MRGKPSLHIWRLPVCLMAALACARGAPAEPTHGSFPYAWRHRGAFAPQTMWFGHYPTRWRQWPGQEYQELSPTVAPAEELPSYDEESGAPKPPDDDTLPPPRALPPAETEPSILPPLEVPGATPRSPLDFDPTQPFQPPSGTDPIPPLLPESAAPSTEQSVPPPSLEPPAAAPSESPTMPPAAEPPLGEPPFGSPPTEGPPAHAEPTPSEPTPSDPIPPLERPGASFGEEPLPEPSAGASIEPDMAGPKLGAALPTPNAPGGRDGTVRIGWVSSQSPAPKEPTRFVPTAGMRPLPGRAAAPPAAGRVEQVTATRVAAQQPGLATPAGSPGGGNPLRTSGGAAPRRNPLREGPDGR